MFDIKKFFNGIKILNSADQTKGAESNVSNTATTDTTLTLVAKQNKNTTLEYPNTPVGVTTDEFVTTKSEQDLENKRFIDSTVNTVIFEEIATPTTPDTNEHKVYFKADGQFYKLDDAGNETLVDAPDVNSIAVQGNPQLTGNVVLVPGTDIQLTQVGQNITITSTASGGGGGGANTTLSNLTSPTAINQNLIPDLATTRDIGSALLPFDNIYTDDVLANNVTVAGGTTTGALVVNTVTDFTLKRLQNVGTPTDPTDGATKAYVDANSGGSLNVQNTFSTPFGVSTTISIPTTDDQLVYINDTTSFIGTGLTLNGQWKSVVYSNEKKLYVAVGNGADRVMTSPDGITWTARTAAQANTWTAVCWSLEIGLFVAVSSDGTDRVMTSPDGITWTSRTPSALASWQSICWSPEKRLLVAVAASGTGASLVMTSTDGITFTVGTAASTNLWSAVIWAKELGLFVAVSRSGTGTRVMTSHNAINWTTRTSSADRSWSSIAYSPELGRLIATADDGNNTSIMRSDDGITWTTTISPLSNLVSIVWSPERQLFMVLSTGGTATTYTSEDGITYTAFGGTGAENWGCITYSSYLGQFVAVASLQVSNTSMRLEMGAFNATPVQDGTEGQKLTLVGTSNINTPKLTNGKFIFEFATSLKNYLTFNKNKRITFQWDSINSKWVKIN